MHLKAGELFAERYRVVRTLGQGGMGHVYAVQADSEPKQSLALKLLDHADSLWTELFRQEFSFLSASRHPNIVHVFDYGVDPKTSIPYYTAELLEGDSLSVDKKRRWNESELVDLLVQMGRALKFLHSRGVLHGDIKPSNMIRLQGDARFVLVDFGLAASMEAPHSDGAIAGTLNYMSPEIRKGAPPDERSDLYSLGVTLYVLATGKFLSKETSQPSVRSDRPDLSLHLDQVLRKLLEENRDARYRHASELLHAIVRTLAPSTPIETEETLASYITAPSLIGRDTMVEGILSSLQGGESKWTLVEGPVGIGKSRLLQEIRRKLQLSGLGSSLIRLGWEATPVTDVTVALARELGCPDHNFESSTSEPGVVSDRSEVLLGWILEKVSLQTHVLLMDDVDLLPQEEQASLFSVLKRISLTHGSKFQVLMSTARKEALLLEMEDSALREFRVPVLSPQEVGHYFELFGNKLHPKVAAAFVQKSGGIPLLMEALAQRFLSSVPEWGKVEFAEQIETFRLTAPSQLYEDGLSHLGKSELKVLKLLAIASHAMSVRTLKKVAPDFSLKILLELHWIRMEMIGRESCVALSNPALGSLVLEKMNDREREEFHRSAGTILGEWMKGDPEIAALHFLKSGELSKAAPFLLSALIRFHRNHSHPEAVKLLQVASPHLLKPELNDIRNELLSRAVDIYSRVGRFDEALRWLEHSGDQGVVRLRKTADLFLKQRKLKEAVKSTIEGEALCPNLREPDCERELVRLLSIRQIAFLFQGKVQDVESLGERIECATDPELSREKIFSFCMRGHAALRSKSFDRAFMLYQQALNGAEEKGVRPWISMVLGSVARHYQVKGENEEALKAYKKAIQAAEEAFDFLAVATHQQNVGTLYQTLGMYADALKAYDRSLELYERIGYPRDHALALYWKAKLLFSIGLKSKTEKMFESALQLAEKSDNPEVAAYCYAILARVKDDDSDAKRCGSAAKNLFQNGKDSVGLRELQLIAYERKWIDSLPEEARTSLDLSQRLRLVKRERDPSLLTDELESACRRDPNVEHLAEYFALKFRLSGSQESAQQAVRLFERQSAQLGEELQQIYLEFRGIGELKKSLPIDPVEHAMEGLVENTAITITPVSIRIARRLSTEAVAQLLDVIVTLNSETDLQALSDRFVDFAIQFSHAERGALVRSHKGELQVITARNMQKHWIQDPQAQMSRSILKKTLTLRQVVIEDHVMDSPEWRTHESVIISGTQSFICVPLISGIGWEGVLYLDRKKASDPFTFLDTLMAEAISAQGSVALAKMQMMEEVRKQNQKIEFLNQQLTQSLQKKERELHATRQLLSRSSEKSDLSARYRQIVGSSAAIRQILETVDQAAKSRSPVYIHGESGTGKELIARALHDHSPWKDKPFVAVLCSAIPNDLFESMFFGHVKGAFTGADQERSGFFLTANEGTILLDEVDTLKPDMQTKLLRVLEESKVRPVGSSEEVNVSVRVIATSTKDLRQLVEKGTFRADLFYRIHVIQLVLPPLREHLEDIPLLVHHFLARAGKEMGMKVPIVRDETLSALMKYDWPGNIRQLKNEVDRILTLLTQDSDQKREITLSMISPDIQRSKNLTSVSGSFSAYIKKISEEVLKTALEKNDWNKSRVAKELGLTRVGLRRKMKRLGITGKRSP